MAKRAAMVGPRPSGRDRPARRERRPPPPLDQAGLERLALRYVERYATTRGKLVDYLRRKLRERGWDGERPADAEALADAHVAAGHVDDAAWARNKADALTRRGYGERRVSAALRANRVEEAEREAALDTLPDDGTIAALRLLKRRRLGAFARAAPDEDARRKTLGVLLRGGHDFGEARAALALPLIEAEALLDQASAAGPAGAWGAGPS